MEIKYSLLIKKLASDSGLSIYTEFQFCESRKWRFDFAIPEIKVAIEYEGQGGRHNTFMGYSLDCDKYNEAILLGWRVFRVTAWHFNKKNVLRTVMMLESIMRQKI